MSVKCKAEILTDLISTCLVVLVRYLLQGCIKTVFILDMASYHRYDVIDDDDNE